MPSSHIIERRHPETWPCDDCGKNHAEVYTMPNGDLLCVRCELLVRRAADHRSHGPVDSSPEAVALDRVRRHFEALPLRVHTDGTDMAFSRFFASVDMLRRRFADTGVLSFEEVAHTVSLGVALAVTVDGKDLLDATSGDAAA